MIKDPDDPWRLLSFVFVDSGLGASLAALGGNHACAGGLRVWFPCSGFPTILILLGFSLHGIS